MEGNDEVTTRDDLTARFLAIRKRLLDAGLPDGPDLNDQATALLKLSRLLPIGVRYPVTACFKPDGTIDYEAAREKAIEYLDAARAGRVFVLPNSRDEKGEYQWEWIWPMRD